MEKLVRILGIDPGFEGGMVLLDGMVVAEMATTPTQPGANGNNEYDKKEILDLLWRWKPEMVVLEYQQSMPKQGVVSTFKIGEGYGMWQGIFAAMQTRLEIVHPRTWQKVMFEDMAKQDTKAASAIVAARLWPGVDWRRTPKCKAPHDGLTDAACIAEYGRRKKA